MDGNERHVVQNFQFHIFMSYLNNIGIYAIYWRISRCLLRNWCVNLKLWLLMGTRFLIESNQKPWKINLNMLSLPHQKGKHTNGRFQNLSKANIIIRIFNVFKVLPYYDENPIKIGPWNLGFEILKLPRKNFERSK